MRNRDSLEVVNPKLAEEWHPTKNSPLTPKDVTPNSNKKVWWKCTKGHDWQALIYSRNSGRGCPYCSGRRASKENCLKTVNPRLAKEWHPTKNDPLTPKDVTPFSSKKVWWRCKKGHEWEATISGRSIGHGCPYCSGRRASKENCLKTVNPRLAKEWHPTKNDPLTPKDVTPFSHKNVWWHCEKGHEWQAVVNNRNVKHLGCPYCSGKRACKDNCLETINPKLAAEWEPTKNGSLTPRDVTPGSNKRVWWICNKGHEWRAPVHRRSQGIGCPYCSGLRTRLDNCLQRINPDVAKEWHPTKNGLLTPYDVSPNSNMKVWWKCKKSHEWLAIIAGRNSGGSCPYCIGRRVCKDNCLETVNPDLSNEWHPTKNESLTPRDVTPGSKRKVWWRCKQGHEWKATIVDRNLRSGCPYCSGHEPVRVVPRHAFL